MSGATICILSVSTETLEAMVIKVKLSPSRDIELIALRFNKGCDIGGLAVDALYAQMKGERFCIHLEKPQKYEEKYLGFYVQLDDETDAEVIAFLESSPYPATLVIKNLLLRAIEETGETVLLNQEFYDLINKPAKPGKKAVKTRSKSGNVRPSEDNRVESNPANLKAQESKQPSSQIAAEVVKEEPIKQETNSKATSKFSDGPNFTDDDAFDLFAAFESVRDQLI